MNQTMTFAEQLKLLRQQAQFSRSEWSEQSGISRVSLWRWETGAVLPREAELEIALKPFALKPAENSALLLLWQNERGVGIEQMLRDHPLPLTHRGLILRAVRVRRGWSQSEAAEIAGVPRSTLAKWEQMSVWPSIERLHELCCAYTASPEELLWITSAAANAPAALPSLEELKERVETLERYLCLPSEMAAMVVSAQISVYGLHDETARTLLARNYVTYAHTLLTTERPQEAEVYLQYAAVLAPQPDPSLRARLLLTQAYVLRAKAALQKNLSPEIAAHSGMKLLERLIPSLDQLAPREQSRVYGDLALTLMLLKRYDEALRLNQKAVSLALEQKERGMVRRRQYERQQILLASGRFREVLSIRLEENKEQDFFVAAFALNHGRALRQLGQETAGVERLLYARSIARRYHIPSLLTQLGREKGLSWGEASEG